MNNTYEMKKYSADKIALLGLFVLALLIARFITASRSAVVLTEPIELNHTGLSVSIPAGNGWRTKKQWRYQQNNFALRSDFVPVSGSIKAQVNCRYFLAVPDTDPQVRFKQKAASIDGVITETNRIQTGPLTVDWVHIEKPETLSDIFFGTARLPDNRQLDIEVLQTTGDTDLAERAFKAVTESLKFEDNQLLKAGTEIITQIKNMGLNHFLDSRFENRLQNDPALYDQNQQSFFLVKNSARQTLGFMTNVFRNSDRVLPLNIEAASFSYIRGRYPREQTTLFQSDNSFDEFIWEIQTTSLTGRWVIEIVLNQGEIITVNKLNPRAKEESYQLNPAAIPKVLLEPVFRQMLDSEHNKFIVDVIGADGTVVPALVSKIDTEQKGRYIFRLRFLDGRGFFEHTTMENILKQFPEWADYILQKNRLLKHNQPQ